jgi:hypothetical protein
MTIAVMKENMTLKMILGLGKMGTKIKNKIIENMKPKIKKISRKISLRIIQIINKKITMQKT